MWYFVASILFMPPDNFIACNITFIANAISHLSHACAQVIETLKRYDYLTVWIQSGNFLGWSENLADVFLHDICELMFSSLFFSFSNKKNQRSGTHLRQPDMFLPDITNTIIISPSISKSLLTQKLQASSISSVRLHIFAGEIPVWSWAPAAWLHFCGTGRHHQIWNTSGSPGRMGRQPKLSKNQATSCHIFMASSCQSYSHTTHPKQSQLTCYSINTQSPLLSPQKSWTSLSTSFNINWQCHLQHTWKWS